METSHTNRAIAPAIAVVAGLCIAMIARPAEALIGETPTIAIHAIALTPGEITVNLQITNPTDVAFGDLVLTAPLPPGSIVDLQVFAAPSGAAIEQRHNSIAWLLKRLPPRSIVGPFAFRVSLDEKRVSDAIRGRSPAGHATARLRWHLPSEGKVNAMDRVVEDATIIEAAAPLRALSLNQVAGTSFRYSMGSGPLYSAPLGNPGSSGHGLFTHLAGTGIRAFIPAGDRGYVTLSRLSQEPAEATAAHLSWIAVYRVSKEQDGSAIFEVPLNRPAPRFSLVRVFVDSGTGFHEQATLGTVSADGVHATFAADGASTYALGIETSQATGGVVNLGPARSVRKGLDASEGISSLFQDSYSGLFGLQNMAEALMGLLIGQTQAGALDGDGDGLPDGIENELRTDPANPDSDADGVSDGDEVFGEPPTDPNEADADDDGLNDGAEAASGTDPWVPDSDGDGDSDGLEVNTLETDPNDACSGGDPNQDADQDGYTDACEQQEGSNPRDGGSKPDDFAPVPGCGGWGTCFSFDGGDTLFYLTGVALTPVLEGLLSIPEASNWILPRGTTAGSSEELDGTDLRAVVGISGLELFVVIPAGQRVDVLLGRPLLNPARTGS